MDCPNCQADNITDYPLCPTCSITCHFPNRKDCKCNSCVWVDYKVAAEMMNRPAAYLRERNADGVTYRYFPEIERWQPGGRGTRLYVRREHVEQWIESSRTPAPVKQQFSGRGFESAIPTLRRLGAGKTMRALGFK